MGSQFRIWLRMAAAVLLLFFAAVMITVLLTGNTWGGT